MTARASRTFVLVHGAWHGGWCWRDVRDQLTALGHKVFTPTLTGLADRAHLMSRDITLDTHVADVAGLLNYEDLRDVCLVGHSYAGWVISGAIEKAADRVASIVYLDAFLPEDGQRGHDLRTPQEAQALIAAWEKGIISRAPPPAAHFFVRPENQAWVDAMMTPQPQGVAFTPVRMTGARDRVAKKTYIRTTAYPSARFDEGLARSRALGWRTFEFDVGHDMMVDAPRELVAALLEVS